MEFATASTLTFSSTFFIVILSIFFLGDRVGIYRWSAVIIGFVGVVMIMKPNSSIFSYYSILPILVAFLWAVQVIVLKFIPDNFSTGKIQIYSLFSSFLGSLIFIFFTTGHTYIESNTDFLILSLIDQICEDDTAYPIINARSGELVGEIDRTIVMKSMKSK